VRVGHHQQRIAVGRRLRDGVGTYDSASAHAVLDHDRLAKRFLQALPEIASVDICGAAGREGNDDLHRLGWIALRVCGCGAGCDGESGDGTEESIRSHDSFLLFDFAQGL
jgi:hypothetical protein